MESVFWIVCLYAAIGLLVLSAIAAAVAYLLRLWTAKGAFFTAAGGAFLSVVVLLLPYFRTQAVTGVSAFFLAFHGGFQAFSMDLGAKEISAEIRALSSADFYAFYSSAVSVMSFVCPLFTFSFLLSLVKNLWPRLLLTLRFWKRAYVFPELNPMTIAFARSVVREKKGLVVFANAYAKADADPDLPEEAENLHAIRFSKSVEELPFHRTLRLRELRFILASKNESEALAEALKLAEKYRAGKKTQVYLYSGSPTAGKVIDSAQNVSHSVSAAVADLVLSRPELIWDEDFWEKNVLADDRDFFLQRIDPVKNLVLKTLSDRQLVEFLRKAADKENKVISLMILGLGSIGVQLLKTAAWLYQVEGYTVEINAFDQRKSEVQQVLEQECPELLCKDLGRQDGDARYDVELFWEMDCFTSTFEEAIRRGTHAEKLKRTQVVFVTLGDDERNIEGAIRLRTLFQQLEQEARLQAEQKGKQEDGPSEKIPMIYSAVYDDMRLDNVTSGRSGADPAAQTTLPSQLRNQKGDSYDVHFFGSLSSQYHVNALEELLRLQRRAVSRHLSWMLVDHYVRQAYEAEGSEFRREIDERSTDVGIQTPLSIYDPLQPASPVPAGEAPENPLIPEVQKYFAFEYYRDSSMATSLHKSAIAPVFGMALESAAQRKERMCELGGDENRRRRVTEHRRWNAYMRGIGYRFLGSGVRDDLGLLHNDLVPFRDLSPVEQLKD